MIEKFIRNTLVVIGSTLAFLSLSQAYAAELFFDLKTPVVVEGKQFQVDLMIDPQNQSINAVSGKIIFPADILKLKEIQDGDSIVNLWVERPPSIANIVGGENGEISFSGIIPGGFNGSLKPPFGNLLPGKILTLIFESEKTGEAAIEAKDFKILLNDGLGTAADLKISNLKIDILSSSGIPLVVPKILTSKTDIYPPQPFEVQIEKNPDLFDGKWFAVFQTEDKESGIDHYETMEVRGGSGGKITNSWTAAEPPYVLKDQELKSDVYIRAVDRAGNFIIVKHRAEAPSKPSGVKKILVYFIFGIIAVILVLLIKNRRLLKIIGV